MNQAADAISRQNSRGPDFKHRITEALADDHLKIAIDRTIGTAQRKRAEAITGFPLFAEARARGRAIKDHVIANLGYYLETFERNALASGAQVHWAQDADEACKIILGLCASKGAKIVTRSKSMLGEEIGLPHALDGAGIERVETDLAEHIVQLSHERPSHIIWPAMHKIREDVAVLFKARHKHPSAQDDIEALVASARRELREKFLTADIGISGANFLIADTGAVCVVTNEGNAELTTTLPRVHIVTAGIEKLVPSMPHAFTMLRLLVRSATGGDITQYITFHCGPKRAGDRDGPDEFHIVLIDNGRTRMLADANLKTMLRCIRCGACMNHCVVYQQIGGHAYGSTYPGPMGAVLTPAIDGLEKNHELPHACTLNGKCQEVCPVDIPLPTLLRGWRDKSWAQGYEPVATRLSLALWTFAATHPLVYRLGTSIAVRFMRLFRKKGWISSMPLAKGWTDYRDFPAPSGQTFLETYRPGNTAE